MPRAPSFGNTGLEAFKIQVSLSKSKPGLVPSPKMITRRGILLYLWVNLVLYKLMSALLQ